MSKPCVALDRDGTIIFDRHYLADPAGVELLPGAAEGLRRLRALGFTLILVTNQSGIGRGKMTLADAKAVDARMSELLGEEDVRLDAIYRCPHAPEDHCDCRKPQPGMLLSAAAEHQLDLPRSFMIGDKISDVQAGRRAGMKTILIGSDKSPDADHAAADLTAAAKWIAANRTR